MDKLQDIIENLVLKYPHKEELSDSRVTKMIYLLDWKSCLMYGKQATSISWYFDNYGPYVSDIVSVVSDSSTMELKIKRNMYGNIKKHIELKVDSVSNLSKNCDELLAKVIKATQTKNYNDFVKFVYSTYPVRVSEKYSHFDLPLLAKQYNEISSKEN